MWQQKSAYFVVSSFHCFPILKIVSWVSGEPRRKGTAWRGWRNRRDGAARECGALGPTRATGPRGECCGFSTQYLGSPHTRTHTHIHSWPPHVSTGNLKVWLCGSSERQTRDWLSAFPKSRETFSHVSHSHWAPSLLLSLYRAVTYY